MIFQIQNLINEIAKLPAIGQRSARRITLFLLKNKDKNLINLIDALQEAQKKITPCKICGNLDLFDICSICQDKERANDKICVVESVEDLWVIERSKCFTGKYHVLNGLLSPLDEITQDTLRIPGLIERCKINGVKEVIMGLNLTLDATITSDYITDSLSEYGISTVSLAAGIPVGGELNYLNDSTIAIAFRGRR